MNYIKSFIFLCIATVFGNSHALLGMTTAMYKPASSMPAPDFAKEGLTILSSTYSFGSTTHAYNGFGNPCNPLEIYGSQTLSSQLLPPWMVQQFLLTIAPDLVNNLGSVNFQGKFAVKELYLEATKNLIHGIFVQGALIIRDLEVHSISMQSQLNPDLTSTQAQTVITTLSNALNTYGLLQSEGGLRKYGIMQSYIFAGWSHHFQTLEHVDFIDFTIKAGLSFPEETNLNSNALFCFPFPANRHIGVPISTSISTGFLDWLNVGGTILCMPWFKTMDIFTMNPTGSNTTLLVPFQGMAISHKNAFYYSSMYIQADHIVKGFSFKFAYSYTSNGQTTLTPIDTITFPKALVNQSPSLEGWYAHTLWSEIEYDFCTKENPNLPTIKLFYTCPLAGKNIIKTPIYGGYLGCILSYNF